MRRNPPLQIGSAEPYSGDMTRWYRFHNFSYGPMMAEVTDGKGVVSLFDVAYLDGHWSLKAQAHKAGTAKITISGTTPDSYAVRQYTFLVKVEDKARLRSGQAYQMLDYR